MEIRFNEIISTEELLNGSKQNLLSEKWDVGIDFVGGEILSSIVKSIKTNGNITVAGNVESTSINTSILPFILRGVTLHGINAEQTPNKSRAIIWGKLSRDWKPINLKSLYKVITIDDLPKAMKTYLDGNTIGRVVIKHG